MSILLRAVYIALQISPYIGLLIAAPYVVIQYKERKSIPVARCTYIYLFALYALTAYFMTMLPFPTRQSVAEMTTPYVQLIPFAGVADFINNSGISEIGMVIPALTGGILWGMLFNVLMLLPLGFGLRFLFQCSFPKTLLIGFLTSLFFELTQLSGLFFVYPRPYRIFDVDDLITNTLGVVIGYAIVPLLARFLPSPSAQTPNRLALGLEVSLRRRFLAAVVDNLIVLLPMALCILIVPQWKSAVFSGNMSQWFLPVFGLYTCLMLLTTGLGVRLFHGKTIGYRIFGLQLHANERPAPSLLQCLLRALLSYGGVLAMPLWVAYFLSRAADASGLTGVVCVGLSVVCAVLYSWFLLVVLLNGITHGRPLFYDKATKTHLRFRHDGRCAAHIRLIKAQTLHNETVDTFAAAVYESLLNEGASEKSAMRVRLLAEGVMLEWIAGGLDGAPCELMLDSRFLRKTLILGAVGKEVPRKQNADDYYQMLGGLRLTFETHYSGNRNLCAIDIA